MFTAVRAMAPVAGIPPNSADAMLAAPWPNSSRSGSCFGASAIPSATFADSRLSSAASAATASAAEKRLLVVPSDRCGSDGVGSDDGTAPIRATFEMRDLREHRRDRDGDQGSGERARCTRGSTTITTTTTATRSERRQVAVRGDPADGACRDDGGVLALRFGDAERGRDLLQEDERCDADREALDDGPRHERDVATQAQERGEEHQRAGEECRRCRRR